MNNKGTDMQTVSSSLAASRNKTNLCNSVDNLTVNNRKTDEKLALEPIIKDPLQEESPLFAHEINEIQQHSTRNYN